MRALLVADDAVVRTALAQAIERAGHEVCGASDVAGVSARVRASRPEVIALAGVGAGGDVRLVLERARASAERRLPTLLLLPADSAWLRTPLPEDLLPALAVAAVGADGPAIGRALATLAAGGYHAAGAAGALRGGSLPFDGGRQRVTGPGGEAALTPSEAALLQDAGALVATAVLAQALWGSAFTDRHARAAIRSHVHGLRRKLARAGVVEAIESRSGVGYRLAVEPDQR